MPTITITDENGVPTPNQPTVSPLPSNPSVGNSFQNQQTAPVSISKQDAMYGLLSIADTAARLADMADGSPDGVIHQKEARKALNEFIKEGELSGEQKNLVKSVRELVEGNKVGGIGSVEAIDAVNKFVDKHDKNQDGRIDEKEAEKMGENLRDMFADIRRNAFIDVRETEGPNGNRANVDAGTQVQQSTSMGK
jgi:hypothetical protein